MLNYDEMKKEQIQRMNFFNNRDKEFWKKVRSNLSMGKSELIAFDSVMAFFKTMTIETKLGRK